MAKWRHTNRQVSSLSRVARNLMTNATPTVAVIALDLGSTWPSPMLRLGSSHVILP